MALPASSHSAAFAGPLYAQVASILRAKICTLEWTSRAPLPNEVSLARDIGVSIGTVRKALEMLEAERLIERRQGRGTFVVETSEETELERFSNLVSGGRKLKAPVVQWSHALGEASREEAQALMCPVGEPIHRLEALWQAGDAATVWDRVCISVAMFPNIDTHLHEAGQFLFPIYRWHYQVVTTKVTEHVSAVLAQVATAEKLGIPPDQACLQVNRIAYDMAGTPVEWSRRALHLGRGNYSVTMT